MELDSRSITRVPVSSLGSAEASNTAADIAALRAALPQDLGHSRSSTPSAGTPALRPNNPLGPLPHPAQLDGGSTPPLVQETETSSLLGSVPEGTVAPPNSEDTGARSSTLATSNAPSSRSYDSGVPTVLDVGVVLYNAETESDQDGDRSLLPVDSLDEENEMRQYLHFVGWQPNMPLQSMPLQSMPLQPRVGSSEPDTSAFWESLPGASEERFRERRNTR